MEEKESKTKKTEVDSKENELEIKITINGTKKLTDIISAIFGSTGHPGANEALDQIRNSMAMLGDNEHFRRPRRRREEFGDNAQVLESVQIEVDDPDRNFHIHNYRFVETNSVGQQIFRCTEPNCHKVLTVDGNIENIEKEKGDEKDETTNKEFGERELLHTNDRPQERGHNDKVEPEAIKE